MPPLTQQETAMNALPRPTKAHPLGFVILVLACALCAALYDDARFAVVGIIALIGGYLHSQCLFFPFLDPEARYFVVNGGRVTALEHQQWFYFHGLNPSDELFVLSATTVHRGIDNHTEDPCAEWTYHLIFTDNGAYDVDGRVIVSERQAQLFYDWVRQIPWRELSDEARAARYRAEFDTRCQALFPNRPFRLERISFAPRITS